jgi:hypothetical protein
VQPSSIKSIPRWRLADTQYKIIHVKTQIEMLTYPDKKKTEELDEINK